MARLTITRAVWGKIGTQFNKPEKAAQKALLLGTKQTLNPASDTILWDPSPEVLEALIEQMDRELTFTRKQESEGYKTLQRNRAQTAKMLQDLRTHASTAPTGT